MKSILLFLSALAWMTSHVLGADTNLSHAIKVARPLAEVVRAMQAYYHDPNYHGNAYAVGRTNAVPGVSYTLTIMDCAFSSRAGLWGEMVATRVATNSTRLEVVVLGDYQFPKDSAAASEFKHAVVRTLERVARIAETKP